MASVAISAKTALISGTAPESGATAASGDTITITAATGTCFDLDKLVLRFWVSAGSAAGLSLGASSTYTSKDLGAYAFTVTSSQTIYMGGKGMESARFLTSSAQSIVFTQSAACAVNVEAIQLPNGFTA